MNQENIPDLYVLEAEPVRLADELDTRDGETQKRMSLKRFSKQAAAGRVVPFAEMRKRREERAFGVGAEMEMESLVLALHSLGRYASSNVKLAAGNRIM